ncbi:MAG: hypothetical protein HOP14_06825 [Acidobacteria bacterium]|nr:hypothetical protein [Acidobacteriota bacterium]
MVLLNVSPDGTSSLQPLQVHVDPLDPASVVTLGEAVPLSNGGVLATWQSGTTTAGGVTVAAYVTAGGITTYEVPGTAWPAGGSANTQYVALAGDGNAVYLGGASQTAIDATDGTVLRTFAGAGQLEAPLEDGGVVRLNQGVATYLDASGASVAQEAVPVADPRLFGRSWVGTPTAAGDIALYKAASLYRSGFQWAFGEGNRQRQRAAWRAPARGINAKSHVVQYPSPLEHVALWVVPTNELAWKTEMAQRYGGDLLKRILDAADPNTGRWFFTIGAGPYNNVPCFVSMLAGIDRERDAGVEPVFMEHLLYSPALENVHISTLLDAVAYYESNPVTYCTFPVSPNSYNSNSFVHGLLNAVDLPTPSFPVDFMGEFPGWSGAVPVEHFQP